MIKKKAAALLPYACTLGVFPDTGQSAMLSDLTVTTSLQGSVSPRLLLCNLVEAFSIKEALNHLKCYSPGFIL